MLDMLECMQSCRNMSLRTMQPKVARYNAQFSVWDDTLSDIFPPSHLDLANIQARAVTEESEHKKAKYVELTPIHNFSQSQLKPPKFLAPRLVA